MKISHPVKIAARRRKNALIIAVLLIAFILIVRFSSAQTHPCTLTISKNEIFKGVAHKP